MKTSDQLCYAKNKFGKPLAERKANVFEMDVDANDGGSVFWILRWPFRHQSTNH